jgi:hypothetical protein
LNDPGISPELKEAYKVKIISLVEQVARGTGLSIEKISGLL